MPSIKETNTVLAIEMFCYRIKYIGAYLAVLGGINAIVFGGGIGENSPEVRARICSGFEWCGLRLDNNRNLAAIGKEAAIHAAGAGIGVYVVPVDEALVIARDTLDCLLRDSRRKVEK
jgi:acetate kinase